MLEVPDDLCVEDAEPDPGLDTELGPRPENEDPEGNPDDGIPEVSPPPPGSPVNDGPAVKVAVG